MNTIPNTTNPTLIECWNIIQGLNDTTKKELIILLKQSLDHENEKKNTTVDDLYGIWGEDGMTDEEFIDALRKERVFTREIVAL